MAGRRRSPSIRRLSARVDSSTCIPSGVDYPNCSYEGNEFQTCYPISSSVVLQNTWTKLIWNPNYPVYTQLGAIDIYLRSEDTGLVVANWTNVPTSQGQIQSCADDSWLGGEGNAYSGTNLTWTFHYVLVQTGAQITGGEASQANFDVLQYQPLNSALASSSSMSNGSTTSPASSASSGSLSSSSSLTNASGSSSSIGSGGLQNDSGKNDFPGWAIALLVVLGFFALIGALFFSFFMCREYRRRQRRKSDLFRRESMGSEAPMMAAVAGGTHTAPQSPTQGPRAAASFPRSYRGHGADASSTTSHTHSAGDGAPFSGLDAATAADAFRNAMRKPDFKDRPLEEGESPDTLPDQGKAPDIVLSRALAEEGRDIRSIGSERGVKIESLLDQER